MKEQTVTDNGNNSVVSDANETADNRHKANASALAFAKAVIKSETSLAGTAKNWGTFVFNAVYSDGNNLDTIIGENKLAAGWANLGNSDEGRKAKQRLNTLFSGARLVAERWTTLSDEQRNGILAGTLSVLYIANELRKADAAVKAEKAKAEAAADVTAIEGGTETVSLVDMAAALLAAYESASDEERADAYDTLALLFVAVDESIERAKAADAQEPEAQAA